jgi:flagellar basal-body rod modification protein FlgD
MSAVNASQATDVLSQYQLKQQSASGKGELGKNEFMELMLAQLKNQNPLDPQDNGEFISQLAQFSSLEEMQKLSGNVDSVVGEFRSTQALQASAMVGKTVLVASDLAMLGASGEVNGTVDVPASTGGVQVSILNGSGELVRQMELGGKPAGSAKFTYYTVASGSYPGGSQQLGTMMSANVDSVSLGKGGSISLNLAGMGSIDLSQVQQIN